MNYAAHNKELHHSLKLSEPTIFMKSDSSLLKDGKPFFIPDFSSEIHYETEIVVKIDRLGRQHGPDRRGGVPAHHHDHFRLCGLCVLRRRAPGVHRHGPGRL